MVQLNQGQRLCFGTSEVLWLSVVRVPFGNERLATDLTRCRAALLVVSSVLVVLGRPSRFGFSVSVQTALL